MLTEERRNLIVQKVEEKGSVSVQELMELLGASESTIRRDLNELDRKRLLLKVHGGAVAASGTITSDLMVAEREVLHRETKMEIARYAASLITDDDVVFLDAGTTTGFIPDFLTCTDAVFITNAISHARKLCSMGYQVYMPGGMLKIKTEALIGGQTCQFLGNFHFTKGFFGTNGVTVEEGFTTPDIQEAAVKELALKQSRKRYIVTDSSKFDMISTVRFAGFTDADVITDSGLRTKYRNKENVLIYDQK
ncbi:MAG: DeoR/GlpR family DNA-binding transcription regulator [Lachnospiraceae bacterium]